jgi:hypothetical protein
LCLCLAGCAATTEESRYVGAWSDRQRTLWLKSDGEFISRETPEASTKPSGVSVLRGTWRVLGSGIVLEGFDEAILYPSPDNITFGSIEHSKFTTNLDIRVDKKALICHQLHLMPIHDDTGSYSFTLTRTDSAPLEWDPIARRVLFLSQIIPPAPTRRVLPPGSNPKGKIY